MKYSIIIAVRAFLLAGAHVETDTLLTVGEDVDADTAASLVRQGCAADASDIDAPAALVDMTVAQLKALAEAEAIDLGAATKKAEIVEAIEAALVARANA